MGTVANQTRKGLPVAATINGDRAADGALSYLPGQRLSRCTCPGESHPGPMHSDNTFVGRAAPEIDIFEAQITGEPLTGQVSQSCQWAPFNEQYVWFNTSDNLIIPDPQISVLNSYRGGAFQQATSVVSNTDQTAYEGNGGTFSVYGFQYVPGFDGAVSGNRNLDSPTPILTVYLAKISISLGSRLERLPGPSSKEEWQQIPQ